ncbi:hypothetical protein B0T20DRAFT_504846 [Sordaria brevicollis]|uniref:Uncharacterized protein n=1 Tax=Sordaria brevicollis TaxID=83679 RepID=A0AAE0PID4_SORBR|nr:hypothetical protein B0T20DRAFT_504846 [Sordaria brevicollis]
MSKEENRSEIVDSEAGDLDLPPPPPSYTEATGSTTTSGFSTFGSTTTSGPGPTSGPISARRAGESPLTTHLRTLPSRLRSAQHSHSTAQSSRETFLVAQCVPHIEWFIEDIVNLPRTPKVAELVLVPAEALPSEEDMKGSTTSGRELVKKRQERGDKGWEVVGREEEIREEGGVVRVGCVCVSSSTSAIDEKGRPVPVDRKMSNNNTESETAKSGDYYSFGDWGRFETSSSTSSSTSTSYNDRLGPPQSWNWFTHPSLARRIASILRPEPTLARKTVQAAVESPKSPASGSSSTSTSTGKKGLSSFFRRSSSKSQSQSESQTPTERVITPVRDGGMLEEDKVAMTVRAEEVTFRRENEFGVWESVSGWGVVVGVRVGRL